MKTSKNDSKTVILNPDEVNEAIRDYLDKKGVAYTPDLCCWSLDEEGEETEADIYVHTDWNQTI